MLLGKQAQALAALAILPELKGASPTPDAPAADERLGACGIQAGDRPAALTLHP